LIKVLNLVPHIDSRVKIIDNERPYTDSDNPFGIFKLFLIHKQNLFISGKLSTFLLSFIFVTLCDRLSHKRLAPGLSLSIILTLVTIIDKGTKLSTAH
jgi:hypothetical protein